MPSLPEELKDLESKLQHTLRKLESIQKALDESTIVVITDQTGKITYVNEAFCRISQYSREELIGNTHRIVNSGYHSREFFKHMWKTIGTGKIWRGEIKNKAKDGSYYWVQSTIVPFLDERGKPYQYVSIRTDITRLKQYEEQIKYMANHDDLTGLPNRRFLREQFSKLLKETKEEERLLAVYFIDLARFKNINDSLGHSVGDEVLKQMADRFQTVLDQKLFLTRVGGDEFVAVAPRVNYQSILAYVRTIQQMLARPLEIEGREFILSANIGISVFPFDGEDLNTLLGNADMALYHAKEEGKFYQFYHRTINQRLIRETILESHLHRAIERDEFILYYQPQYDLFTGELIRLEALIRWYNSELGWIRPDQFIPLAEKIGLMPKLDEWVLSTACRHRKMWKQRGGVEADLSINLSASHFQIPGMAKRLLSIIESNGDDPCRWEFEVTEHIMMQDSAVVYENISQLKEAGVKLAIDDFGVGYSSLGYIKKLKVDRLKIDRSFIKNLPQSADDQAIVAAVITMAHQLSIDVVAEGIENEKQIQILKEMGCNGGQGYFWRQPVSETEIGSLLQCNE
ncbi:Phytochrome-like protein cph2 [Geobacillus stearothermophilus]|uniref:putative bifunctional diguanylate cyclase/phosphodiesterase n=1 Tax=unclassified Geobacillus TaxID=2642459 RepID=UPI0007AC143B|nr:MULTISPECIES: GGDEF domain-containing phosphodiesterase [unclassified Geobacillus]KZE96024.1 Phytochrome-like protein cph2 [Geobacillus stearothermophilus]NNU99490.1 phosphodiesterase [Geobacillus sp. DSP4a]PJW14060.1 phosphodiesterase [Geobacillus sp. Manikaran-105]